MQSGICESSPSFGKRLGLSGLETIALSYGSKRAQKHNRKEGKCQRCRIS